MLGSIFTIAKKETKEEEWLMKKEDPKRVRLALLYIVNRCTNSKNVSSYILKGIVSQDL
jgi:hypothetical protein